MFHVQTVVVHLPFLLMAMLQRMLGIAVLIPVVQ
jgi:hypothetical protein